MRASNTFDWDNVAEFYPWAALAGTALHHHVVPLWNPYAFIGTPLLGAMQPAVFYPVNLILEAVLSPVDVIGWRAIVHLPIALIGSYAFARGLGLSRVAGLLTAMAFGLGLPFTVWLEHPMDVVFAWLPWLLLGIDRIVRTSGS